MLYLDNVSKIIKIDIEKFYKDVVDFYNNYHQYIVQYYTQKNTTYPKTSFELLEYLQNQVNYILSKINLYQGNFNNTIYWDILEQLEEIKSKLETIKAYPKFYKISFYKNTLDKKYKKYETYIQKQNETIEQIADKFEEEWIDLAILNNLREEDYTNAGGKKFILRSSKIKSLEEDENNTNEGMESIIDVCLGSNVLGKDFPNYFEFDEEEEDLKVRTPKETFIYTVKRLFKLVKGSIPEYPDLGIAKDLMYESVKGDGFFFPVLLRQLSESIATDDTILTFSIDDIDKKEDSYFISASVTNRLLNNLKFESSLEESTDEGNIRGDEYLKIYENDDIVGGTELDEITLRNTNGEKNIYLKSNTTWKIN